MIVSSIYNVEKNVERELRWAKMMAHNPKDIEFARRAFDRASAVVSYAISCHLPKEERIKLGDWWENKRIEFARVCYPDNVAYYEMTRTSWEEEEELADWDADDGADGWADDDDTALE